MALRLAVSFDENNGTTFTPTVGPGTGTLVDPAKAVWVPGVNGAALGRYNTGAAGSESGFNTGLLSGLSTLDMASWPAMTLMAWVLFSEAQTERWPVVLSSSVSDNDGWMGWRLPVNSSLITSHLNGQATSGNYLQDPAVWQHLCTTWDGTTQRLYIDGVLSAEGAVAGPLRATTHISIGAAYSNYGATGVDDLRLFDEALTAMDIMAFRGLPTGSETGGGGEVTLVNKLRVGATTPSKLYVGTTEINKVYRGTMLVYGEASGNDPDPQEDVPRLYMTPDSGTFVTGATVEVTIRADSQTTATNVVQANFTYPTNRLTFQSIDTSMSPYTTTIQSTGGSGEVKIGVGLLAGEATGNQIVGVVTFTAASAGPATLSFTNESGIVERATSTDICEQMTGSIYTIT